MQVYHPKLCYSYIKHGEKRGGCRKGNQCKYAHPKLCLRALDTRVCTNKSCRLYHVAGTKFTIEDNSSRLTPAQPSAHPHPSYRETVLGRNNQPSNNDQQTTAKSTATDDQKSDPKSNDNSNFLEMQKDIRAMQEQIQMLMAMMKSQAQMYSSLILTRN